MSYYVLYLIGAIIAYHWDETHIDLIFEPWFHIIGFLLIIFIVNPIYIKFFFKIPSQNQDKIDIEDDNKNGYAKTLEFGHFTPENEKEFKIEQ